MRLLLACLALAALPLAVMAAEPAWTPSSFTQAIILGVSFSDAKNGYISGGDNGVGSNALKSNDGGVTWTNVPIHEPALMIMAVAAASPESAIISGIGMLSGSTQYTTDGQSFLNASEPLVSLEQVQDAEIIGDGEGFAVTGQFSFFGSNATLNGVGLSTNGGANFTFSEVSSDPNVPARYSSFPSSSVGFVASGAWPPNKKTYGKWITRNLHVHANHAQKEQYMHLEVDHEDLPSKTTTPWVAAIYRSTDGFATWQQVFSNDTYYMNQISCPSEQTCYAVAENDATGFGLRSTDGGNTWQTILEAPGVSMMAAHALSEDEFYFGGGVIAQAGVTGHIYHSTDGGDTFELDTLDNYYLTGMSFVDSTHGWATAIDSEDQSNVLIYA